MTGGGDGLGFGSLEDERELRFYESRHRKCVAYPKHEIRNITNPTLVRRRFMSYNYKLLYRLRPFSESGREERKEDYAQYFGTLLKDLKGTSSRILGVHSSRRI